MTALPRRAPGATLDPLHGLVTRVHPIPTPLDVQLHRVGARRPTTPHGWTERLDLPPLTPSSRARPADEGGPS
ncbi:hypothetical protein [Oerskovia paurometabola]|uniref:hypothetical protein n=1 Tax=Oerskovia paurometabola TaxID=162170 RepID=UPI0037F7D379